MIVNRGFASIGLDRPKCLANLGGVLRAAQCYGAASVHVFGDRLKRVSTDTTKAYRHIPCLNVDDLMASVPFGAMPVVIEIHERAKSLVNFNHPPAAFYIFGPEDGSVRKEIVERCPLVIKVPTAYCMNLAATVNVVLYDRAAKEFRQ